ncbi:MAG: hypothetical protein NUW22_12360 [Acidobacteria bacterium]|nr:hypothetical protein [Acidobacteriota bacterium]
MKFLLKPVVVDAITFDELVAHGIASGATYHNGMPWSFHYAGSLITYENDNCYLVNGAVLGLEPFTRGDMLITNERGEIGVCNPKDFADFYEPFAPATPGYAAPARNGEGAIWFWERGRALLQEINKYTLRRAK